MRAPLDATDRAAFLAAAEAIAERIARVAEDTWETAEQGERPAPAGEGDLYRGSAGVALFLLRLGRQTGCARTLERAGSALRHAVARESIDGARGGYYSGTAGVAAVCAEMASETGEERWLDAARRLCRQVARGLTPQHRLDLIDGEAGTILGLLQVYEITRDRALLTTAGELAEVVIDQRRPEPEGLSWDTLHPCVLANPLGISHGAGGIGLALLELHRLTGDPRLAACAEESLRYEDSYFDAERGWPDLRHQPLAEYFEQDRLRELRRDVAEGVFQVAAAKPGWMTAWCHGAPGIALVRARFCELSGSETCRAALLAAAELTQRCVERWRPGNHSLCHGLFGNADVLLELSRRTGDERYAEAALAAARRELARVSERGEPWLSGSEDGGYRPGLMVGEAGIGLFFLRLLDPEIPPVLLPSPRRGSDRQRPAQAAPTAEAIRLGALEAAIPAGDAAAFRSLILELLKQRLSPAELYVTSLMRRPSEYLREPEVKVRLGHSARLFVTEAEGDAGRSFLIHQQGGALKCQALEPLAARLYTLFAEPASVASVLDSMVAHLGSAAGLEDPDAAAAVRHKLGKILRRAYDARILEIVEPFEMEPREVDGDLCMRCGECCRIKIYVQGDETYREFIAEMLGKPLAPHYPELKISLEENGDKPHVVLDLGDCRHLQREVVDGETRLGCAIYATRPETCRRFNCVSWWRQQRPVATTRSTSDRLLERVAVLAGKKRSGEPSPGEPPS